MTKLHRSEQNQLLGGVCAGIAETYDLDTTLVRLLAVASAIWSFGTAIFIYLILWLVVPAESEVYQAEEVDVEEK